MPFRRALRLLGVRHSYSLISARVFRPLHHHDQVRSGKYVASRRWVTTSLLSAQDSEKLQVLALGLSEAVDKRDNPAIRRLYRTLSEEMRIMKQAKLALLQERDSLKVLFMRIIKLLLDSDSTFEHELAEKILTDMPVLYGITVPEDVYTGYLTTLLLHNQSERAMHWLRDVGKKSGHPAASHNQWHLLLEYLAQRRYIGAMRHVLLNMNDAGCRPSIHATTLILEAIRKYQVGPRVFANVLNDIKRLTLPCSSSILKELELRFTESGQYRIHLELLKRFMVTDYARRHAVDVSDSEGIDRNLSLEARNHGVERALLLYDAYSELGYKATTQTLKAMLTDSTKVEHLRLLEKRLCTQADVNAWSILIRNAVQKKQRPLALSVYDQALASGVRPTPVMIHPLLRAFCSELIRPPTSAQIDKALKIFHDLVQTPDSDPPDQGVYNTLLRALASSANTQKHYPIAIDLLEDMRERRIAMDKMTMTSLTVLLMRLAGSLEEAIAVFRSMRQIPGWNGLDQKGYLVILQAYCKLSFPRKAGSSAEKHYFEIISNMRADGHHLTEDVYMVILRELALEAGALVQSKEPVDEGIFRYLIFEIRHIHRMLAIESDFSPKIEVWNQLMDTYQRAGCFTEAFNLCESLLINGRFDNSGLSIMMDACGFHGRGDIADRLWRILVAAEFPFNRRNWHTRLECFCRLGRLDEAVRILCMEMGKQFAPGVQAANIVLKFSRQARQTKAVQERIRKFLPDLWKTLPAEMKSYHYMSV